MNVGCKHSDTVYSTALKGSTAARSPIAASWRRCLDVYGLSPDQAAKPRTLDQAAFRQARERMDALIAASSDELDRLFQTVGRSGCCLVLADAQGVVLERRSASGDDADFHRLGLWEQAEWSEQSVGTNGIGTALADERPVIIHRDQHFLSANIALSCATVPVRDHRGQLAAALDISTCRHDVTDLSMNILAQALRDAAVRVETNLFRMAFPMARIIMLPNTATPAALLAVDGDDLVLGATRAARMALQIDDQLIAAGLPAADALREKHHDAGDDLIEAERSALKRVLSRAKGNVSRAAQLLGISRATLHRKMKRFDIH
ncbi:GAF domain-containing protein [Allorhizobium terrae]|uniref:Sigma-54-dependent Fis family transcriptional regulator n=1 Tax=Allorhizobium terrae TaxID=1848972 RepID=A0A4S4A6M6_9HYPH|nr:GAF domain-containing protein [Allorhizobium terrae]THF54241.1 sigma-54-dependent Fis family transcriptional regulator [Allorhizobium terrae]TWD54381.1 transcriptional regulator [Agrobacterium vitis]